MREEQLTQEMEPESDRKVAMPPRITPRPTLYPLLQMAPGRRCLAPAGGGASLGPGGSRPVTCLYSICEKNKKFHH